MSRPAAERPPALVLAGIFESALCRDLIADFDRDGGSRSAFKTDRGGRTVEIYNPKRKVRRDYMLRDDELRARCLQRIGERVVPEVAAAFGFRATHMERFMVSCYDAAERGFIGPHRDNGARGTAHRQFAVSLFLNEDFDGGRLRFPELGEDLYAAPAGGAVVFPCSQLHEGMPVTRGTRYMFIPFLFDAEGVRIRERNLPFAAPGVIEKTGDHAAFPQST